ncbi:helix-turn-helix transcriptional regulator [Streptomyces atratus]|uniref:helix-turn-helix domain-containing protein n=1 Tax=Streptomyces atratus TaxID=1893 RepID=UPI0021A8EA01|nr:helix-turn-helix transcriptional regulator [Streptomyces atratus]MCT2542361.1 helix-turn-helix transcriptional regulator [Streptomyces atratus]
MIEPSPAPSARVAEARERVAGCLRELRLDAGLTGQDLAARTGWHGSKVSRMQGGVSQPSDDDIRAWCLACDAEDQAADIIAVARTASSMYSEWRRQQRTGLRRLQEARVPLYERTTTMRVYSSSVIPGLLQTHGYAKALLTTIGRFSSTPDDFEAAANARVARAEILRRAGRRFDFVIEEAALRRVVGGVETMADQLGSLFALASLPAVSLGVIPARAPALWPMETFTVYDEESASVELLTARLTITAPSEVEQYLDVHRQMSESALVGPAAYRTIADAIAALG